MNDLQALFADINREIDKLGTTKPVVTFHERRLAELEEVVRRFCIRSVEQDVDLWESQSWRDAFRDLCEYVDFDPKEYRVQGFDPEDV